MIAWHGADDAVIDAAGLPVQALDYAASRDGNVPALYRDTGLDYAASRDGIMPAPYQGTGFDHAASRDGIGPVLWNDTGLDGPSAPTAPSGAALTPRQYLRLLDNTARVLGSPDTSFMLGQRMLPGGQTHAGSALAGLAGALRHAPSLRVALALLVDWQPLVSPLLCPRVRVDGDQAALYWTDSYGAPGMLPFLVEMHMAAVVSLCRWLSGERLPWRFCFNRARPRHAEQHEVHLGHDLRFGCHLDVMLLDAAWLDRPWPGGDAVRMEQGLAAAGKLGIPPSLPSALYGYLLERVRNAPSLEQAAHDFGVSPATLKRKLARHHTHYQAELDLARTHMALYLFQSRRAGNEAVARELGFNDAANFRRSFKRWTGSAPGLLRDWLLA